MTSVRGLPPKALARPRTLVFDYLILVLPVWDFAASRRRGRETQSFSPPCRLAPSAFPRRRSAALRVPKLRDFRPPDERESVRGIHSEDSRVPAHPRLILSNLITGRRRTKPRRISAVSRVDTGFPSVAALTAAFAFLAPKTPQRCNDFGDVRS
jgi:hypothetical protein